MEIAVSWSPRCLIRSLLWIKMPVPSQRGDYFCCFVKKYAKNPSYLKHRLPFAKKCCKTIQAGLTYLQMPLIRSSSELPLARIWFCVDQKWRRSDETHLSTIKLGSQTPPRFSLAYGDKEWP